VRIVLKASEISKIVFKKKHPFSHSKQASLDLMSLGKFVERYLVSQVGSTLGLNIQFVKNKENITKKILEIGDIDVYLRGRADGRVYATYVANDKLIRYDYIVEVKHLITHTLNNREVIVDYYKPQIVSYNILYELPVLFYALLQDGFIFQVFNYDEIEVNDFKQVVRNHISSHLFLQR
jgi:hypothetical protein